MKSPIPKRQTLMSELEMFEVLQALFPDEVTDENCDYDWLEEFIHNKFEVGVEEFTNIAGHLIYLTPQLRTALSGRMVHAFGTQPEDDPTQFIALMKREAVQ